MCKKGETNTSHDRSYVIGQGQHCKNRFEIALEFVVLSDDRLCKIESAVHMN